VIVGFIDEHRDTLGVEPICKALQIAPSTYYAAKRRTIAPSARAVRDAVMLPILLALWIANRKGCLQGVSATAPDLGVSGGASEVAVVCDPAGVVGGVAGCDVRAGGGRGGGQRKDGVSSRR
jgi:hypothetical protein